MQQFLVGLDVGSTTVKAIVVDAATDTTIWQDYQRGGRSDRPGFLAPFVAPADTRVVRDKSGPARQARFLNSPV